MAEGHGHQHTPTERIGVALALNLAFTVVEIVGGLLTNSMAVLSDALHDLGDTISLGLAWHLTRVSRRRGDELFTYGYRRFTLLSALAAAVVLVAGAVIVLAESIPRILSPESTIAPGMLALALLGLAVNGVAALRMRGGTTLNERIVTWHFLEDVLGWAAVLAASVIMMFWDVPILDPVLSVLITVYVLWNVIRHLRSVLSILLQAVPGEIRLEDIERRIRAIPGICDVHHTHVWSQDGEHHVLTTHIVPQGTVSLGEAAALRAAIRANLRRMGVQHATIEVEAPGTCPCDEHDGECRA